MSSDPQSLKLTAARAEMGDGLGGSDRVHSALRQEILRLALAPGARLDEAALSARFAVSRTPVREALIRLTAEGLVESARGHGARVAALDLSNLRPFFEALDLLQRAVTRLAALRRSPAQLERIRRLSQAFDAGALALDSTAANEANFHLHAAIAEAAQSDYLAQAYERCMGDGLRLGYLCFSEHTGVDQGLRQHLRRTMDDHAAMVAAIEAQDGATAEAVAADHVDLFRGRMATALMSAQAVRSIAIPDGAARP
ncbi:MAG: GntR family transcriptional regulator [Alkalilacustris sp.]